MKIEPSISILPNRNLAMLLATLLALFGCGKQSANENRTKDTTSSEEAIPDSQFPEDIQRIARKLHWPATAVAKIRNLPKEELQRMSEECINQNHSNVGGSELKAAEDLVADIFIDAILKSDAFTKRSGAFGDFDCRAYNALSFLNKGVHPRLIPVLKEIMRREDSREIRIITHSLTSFANMEVLEETAALLRHSDPNVARMARLGVSQALQEREVSAEFRSAIWPACEASFLTCKPDISYSRDATRLLVVMDKEKALQTFQSAGILDVNHPLLASVLEELIRIEMPPEESLLLAVLDKKDYPNAFIQTQLHAQSLLGLAQRKSPKAEERIMRVLDGEQRLDKTLGTAAWKARFKLAGRTPLVESAINAYFAKEHKIENLAADERRVCLISFADSEFRNGGVTGWFGNHHGCYSVETLEALQHIGTTKHAEIFKAINGILSPNGSVENLDDREKIMENLTDQESMKLDRAGDQWYKPPSWEVLVYKWDWERKTT